MLRGLTELERAVLGLKMRKCGDDVGLTAVGLKHVATKFWEHLLQVYNFILDHDAVPRSCFFFPHLFSAEGLKWMNVCVFFTLFNMLPKKMRPKQVADFRTTAGLYKVFACLVLERIEHQLDDHQPEQQHGFRRGKRIEEHVSTANLFLDI